MRHLNALLLVVVLAGCQLDAPSMEPSARVAGFELELEPATQLFAPNFQYLRVIDGRVDVVPGVERSCYWSGRLRGDDQSRVAVRACRADFSDLTGIVLSGGEGWFIEDGHARTLRPREGRCGVESTAPLAPREHVSPERIREQRAALSTGQPRFIELLIAEDSQVAAQPGAVDDTVLMVHMAAALYDNAEFDDRTLPVLVGVVDAGGSDPWGAAPISNGEALSGPYLDNFNGWLESASSLPDYDVAVLFTGWDLDGLTVGLANVEGACDPSFSGVLVDAVDADDAVSQTLAHEIGHTIGLEHDGVANNCDPYDFIMTSIYTEGGPYPTEFSSCSLADGSRWLRTGQASCISLESQPSHEGPTCGDGLVEGTEQCDCGPAGCAGRDPCCDGATCRLKAGASCSVTDGCCDATSCEPVRADADVVCRVARSDCDIAELCDGGAHCPTDTFRPTGEACVDDLGYDGACMTGVCATRGSICEALTDDYVLDPEPYDDMCADAGCEVMECVYEGACVFTSYGTPDGTPCGAGQQCFRGACVSSSTLPGADGCGAPDLDSDGDGTRDCDDGCPFDPGNVNPPCVERTPSTNNGSSNNSANNGGGPGQQTNGTSDADPVVIVKDDDPGCATSGRAKASPWLVWVGILLVGFRRRGRRTSACRPS